MTEASTKIIAALSMWPCQILSAKTGMKTSRSTESALGIVHTRHGSALAPWRPATGGCGGGNCVEFTFSGGRALHAPGRRGL